MKEINSYIIEKLKINKDSKIEITKDSLSAESIPDILTSIIIYCQRDKVFKETGASKHKTIYLSRIYYKDVIVLLNDLFGYNIEYNLITNNELDEIAENYKKELEKLLNGKLITIKINDKYESIDGVEILRKYKDIIFKK